MDGQLQDGLVTHWSTANLRLAEDFVAQAERSIARGPMPRSWEALGLALRSKWLRCQLRTMRVLLAIIAE
jgi:hypothetical protein